MTPLGQYYIRQAGGGGFRGRGARDIGVGPIYSIPPFIQRGHGIGSTFGRLYRVVRPLISSGAKSLGREALRTGAKIMNDIADDPHTNVRDVVSKHLSATKQNLLRKLRGGGRKRKRAPTLTAKRARDAKTKRKRNASSKRKASKAIKRDIFS
jgi:hypothetical protein